MSQEFKNKLMAADLADSSPRAVTNANSARCWKSRSMGRVRRA